MMSPCCHAQKAFVAVCPLQPCLGGSARTAILATINPSHLHVEETLNTLLFAQRTMNVVNTVVQNRVGAHSKGSSKEQVGLVVSEEPHSSSISCRKLPWIPRFLLASTVLGWKFAWGCIDQSWPWQKVENAYRRLWLC